MKTSGDGFLVTFASARKAVAFAVDVQATADYRRPPTPSSCGSACTPARSSATATTSSAATSPSPAGCATSPRRARCWCRRWSPTSPTPPATSPSDSTASCTSPASTGRSTPARRLAGHDAHRSRRPRRGRRARASPGQGASCSPRSRERPLVAWAVEHAVDAALDEVIVVVGGVELARALPAGVTVVRNDRWADGMATSLAAGVGARAAGGHDAVVVGLGDQPVVDGRRVAARGGRDGDADRRRHLRRRAGQPGAARRRGVGDACRSSGDEGARRLLHARRPELVTEVPCPGSAVDVDTVEDLAAWS